MGQTFRKDLETLPDSAKDYFIVETTETQIDIAPYQTNVVITSHLLNFNLVLPPVAECAGVIYSITLTTATGGKAVTLVDYGVGVAESTDWADLTLNATGDRVQLQSTGKSWAVIENSIAP